MENSVLIIILLAIVFFFIGAITAFMYISISRWHVSGRKYGFNEEMSYEHSKNAEILAIRQETGIGEKSSIGEFKKGK